MTIFSDFPETHKSRNKISKSGSNYRSPSQPFKLSINDSRIFHRISNEQSLLGYKLLPNF